VRRLEASTICTKDDGDACEGVGGGGAKRGASLVVEEGVDVLGFSLADDDDTEGGVGSEQPESMCLRSRRLGRV
jgi:hypothetical protein